LLIETPGEAQADSGIVVGKGIRAAGADLRLESLRLGEEFAFKSAAKCEQFPSVPHAMRMLLDRGIAGPWCFRRDAVLC